MYPLLLPGVNMPVTPWLPQRAARRGPPLTACALVHVSHKTIKRLLTITRLPCRVYIIKSMGLLHELKPPSKIKISFMRSSPQKCIDCSGPFPVLLFCHDDNWDNSSLDYSQLAPSCGYFWQASFVKQLMAEQHRHVLCFGDGRN